MLLFFTSAIPLKVYLVSTIKHVGYFGSISGASWKSIKIRALVLVKYLVQEVEGSNLSTGY